MGPFVPDFISDQLNLIVALFLGIGFGFALEQAGFSSSRRLAGVFYGYDFTVLRVFFTAAVTAMSGTLLLSYFGLLDLSAIYINPTWLMPAIVGGVIMGIGFVLGGYCPGTSICAAAIGKIDAMFFVVGGMVGVFLFGELYHLYDNFFVSTSLGSIKVFDSLGISQGLFALILIVVAVGAFAATTLLEKHVNKTAAPSLGFHSRKHIYVGIATLLLGVLLVFLPDRKTGMIEKVSSAGFVASHPVNTICSDELAFRIMDNEPTYHIVDIRSHSEYSQFALPHSDNIAMLNFFGKEWNGLLSQRHTRKVIIGDNEMQERAAYLLLRELGYENLVVLEGGLPEFRSMIFDPSKVIQTGSRWDGDVNTFHQQAHTEIGKMIADAKNKPVGEKKPEKKIKGGC